jgi:hypothetical protein
MAGKAFAGEKFARRRERREETRRRMKERRELLAAGLDQLVTAARELVLVSDGTRRMSGTDLAQRLRPIADEVDRVYWKLDFWSQQPDMDAPGELLRQGGQLVHELSRSLNDMQDPINADSVETPLRKLEEIRDEYLAAGRPEVAPFPVKPLFSIDWRQLRRLWPGS